MTSLPLVIIVTCALFMGSGLSVPGPIQYDQICGQKGLFYGGTRPSGSLYKQFGFTNFASFAIQDLTNLCLKACNDDSRCRSVTHQLELGYCDLYDVPNAGSLYLDEESPYVWWDDNCPDVVSQGGTTSTSTLFYPEPSPYPVPSIVYYPSAYPQESYIYYPSPSPYTVTTTEYYPSPVYISAPVYYPSPIPASITQYVTVVSKQYEKIPMYYPSPSPVPTTEYYPSPVYLYETIPVYYPSPSPVPTTVYAANCLTPAAQKLSPNLATMTRYVPTTAYLTVTITTTLNYVSTVTKSVTTTRYQPF